ncbi:MAG: hypothetical protein R3A80_01535 [Bdellovibrionota bacterium]
MAPEFEFDLSYFGDNSEIRKYLDIAMTEQQLLVLDKSKVPPAKFVFVPKENIDPKVQALLSRFEFDWEDAFSPPKVEIRYRAPLSSSEVKRDVSDLLMLFSKNKAEHEKLLRHLSSIRANTDEVSHLNIHIHASDPSGVDRVEVFKRYQMLTTLEMIHSNNAEEATRVFTSSSSAYSNRHWMKGVGRSVGLSRYESRKRNVPILDDIDRLDEMFSENPQKMLDSFNHSVSLYSSPELIKKILDMKLPKSRRYERLELLADLYEFSEPRGSTRSHIKSILFENDHLYLADIVKGVDSLAKLKFLAHLLSDAPLGIKSKAWMSREFSKDLVSMSFSHKVNLLTEITQALGPEQQLRLFSLPVIREGILDVISKRVEATLTQKIPDWPRETADLLGVHSDALPAKLSQGLDRIKTGVLGDPGFKFINQTHFTFFLNPRGLINALSDEQKADLFKFMDTQLESMTKEQLALYTELHERYFIKYSKNRPVHGCREAL